MNSIQPSFVGKDIGETDNPFKQTELRASLIESIDNLLPTQGQALHNAAKVHFKNHGKLIRGTTALMMSQAVGLEKKCSINETFGE